MIGKEFDITTLDLSPKQNPNFKPVSVQEVIRRYQGGTEVHLFIEQPHLDENGKRVCNIYDCIHPNYMQHQNFVDEAVATNKKLSQIIDETKKDGALIKKIIQGREVRHSCKILSNVSWPVEIMVNACGLIRIFQYFHPASGEICEIQFPLKSLYGKAVQPEQYDVLTALYKHNVIKDDGALGHAEHVHARLKRDYEEFMEDVKGLTR